MQKMRIMKPLASVKEEAQMVMIDVENLIGADTIAQSFPALFVIEVAEKCARMQFCTFRSMDLIINVVLMFCQCSFVNIQST